jgi:hypothetical protein
MNRYEVKPWYKKKRYAIPIASFLGLLAISGSSTPVLINTVQGTQEISQVLEKTQVIPQQQKSIASEVSDQVDFNNKELIKETSTLSNSNYYINTQGSRIHSPAYTSDNSIPAGASARCRDGTYSFSQSRRGTCSRHGGVSEWL